MSMDWGEAEAAQIVGSSLRKWAPAATPADRELIALTASTAGLAVAMQIRIGVHGATLEEAAFYSRVTSQLHRCRLLLEASSPCGAIILDDVLKQAQDLAQALLELAQPAGEA